MIRPIEVTLNQTGLSPKDGSFVATPGQQIPGQRFAVKDQLLLFDNSVAAFDKQPRAVYYYSDGVGQPAAGWRLLGDLSGGDRGNDVIPAGSAMLIRKAKTASNATVFWLNAPAY
jgi:uncharacterized protein (TIGR02597 family)